MDTRKAPQGILDANDRIIRRQWSMQKLYEYAEKSPNIFRNLTGSDFNQNVIIQKNNPQTELGSRTVFQFDAFAEPLVTGLHDTTMGTEDKAKILNMFVDLHPYYIAAQGLTKFDANEVGNLSYHAHSALMQKLNVAWKQLVEQFHYDTLLGVLGESSSHTINVNSPTGASSAKGDVGLSYGVLCDIAKIIKTGKGFTTGEARMPMYPVEMSGKVPKFILMADINTIHSLRKDSNFIQIMSSADIRGDGNRLISGFIGTIGEFIVIESPSPQLVSSVDNASSPMSFKSTKVVQAGLREYDSINNAYTGMKDFNGATDSRCLILGRDAMVISFGGGIDYIPKVSEDYAKTLSAALTVPLGGKKVRLDYSTQSKVESTSLSGYDVGVVQLNLKRKA